MGVPTANFVRARQGEPPSIHYFFSMLPEQTRTERREPTNTAQLPGKTQAKQPPSVLIGAPPFLLATRGGSGRPASGGWRIQTRIVGEGLLGP